jgi:hypothetical protein
MPALQARKSMHATFQKPGCATPRGLKAPEGAIGRNFQGYTPNDERFDLNRAGFFNTMRAKGTKKAKTTLIELDRLATPLGAPPRFARDEFDARNFKEQPRSFEVYQSHSTTFWWEYNNYRPSGEASDRADFNTLLGYRLSTLMTNCYS